MNFEERGTVSKLFAGREDHGILTVQVQIDFGGAVQGFGGLALDADTAGDFSKDFFAIFGKRPGEDLVGEKVIAYRCFESLSAPIEAIRSERTKRVFSLLTWRRKHWPKTPDPLKAEIDRIEREIDWVARRKSELETQLASVGDRYRAVPR